MAIDKKDGVWWCFSHSREATHIDKNGKHICEPGQSGITLPCNAYFIEDIEIVNEND